jgi:hypothetical protein
MTGRTAVRPLHKAVWWSIGIRVAGVLLALCAAAGIRVGSTARLALELAMTVPLVFLVARTATAYSRYRRDGLTWRAALYAVAADVVSVPVLRLMTHEFRLYTSTLRWLTGHRRRRPPRPRPRTAERAMNWLPPDLCDALALIK